MAEFKLVISDPKTGKSLQKEVKDDSAKRLIGQKIGDTFKGELIDMPGYEFTVTGGSDSSGFPMRHDVSGSARKKITAVKGVGVHNKKKLPNPKKKGIRTINGMRLKKTVAGNTVHAKTAQINLKVTKHGREPLFEEVKPAPEEAKGGDKMETPTEAKQPKTVPDKTEELIEEEEETDDVPTGAGESVDDAVATSKEVAPAEEHKTEKKPSEEVKENVEEVPIGAGEAVAEASEKPKKEDAPNAEEKPAEETSDDDKTSEELDKIDEEVKKDEEEIAKESEEIEKIEKELKDAEEEDKRE